MVVWFTEETSHLSEDAWTRSPCYDSILMKGQVSVKPTSELLIADKMVVVAWESHARGIGEAI